MTATLSNLSIALEEKRSVRIAVALTRLARKLGENALAEHWHKASRAFASELRSTVARLGAGDRAILRGHKPSGTALTVLSVWAGRVGR